MSLTLATVTATSPPTVKVDGDSVDLPLILLSGQSVSVGDRVCVWQRGSGLRPALLTGASGSGGGSSGVSSFNTRTGAVTLTKADVTGTGLDAADVGAAPEITALAGRLGSNVTGIGTGSATTVLTTSSLGVGTWLVSVGIVFTTGSATGALVSLAVGSGTATITGQASTVAFINGTYNGCGSISALVTVTAAATLTLSAQAVSGTVTAQASNPTTGTAGATGWTAVKVA